MYSGHTAEAIKIDKNPWAGRAGRIPALKNLKPNEEGRHMSISSSSSEITES